MKKWIIGGCILIVVGIIGYFIERNYELKQLEALKKLKKEKAVLVQKINKNYHPQVKVVRDTDLYQIKKEKYVKSGKVTKDMEFTLEDRTNEEKEEEYFKIDGMNAYISYQDVTPIEKRAIHDIYKNYIPFNLDIVTKNPVLYEKEKQLFALEGDYTFKVLGKSSELYYVEFNQMFLSIPKKYITREVEKHYTDLKNAVDVAVLNYHFFYDEDKGETCDQVICHERKTFVEHLNYLKEQNFFATDMESFSLYLDGTIQLPEHTVLITIDDGVESVKTIAIPLLNEYKMNATIFLITAWYTPEEYTTDYVECHSHTHEMHEANVCPGDPGKGGGLTCLDPEVIKKDLQASRERLHGSTALAYPFYDYNDYAIEQLKNNGFTMAFQGGFEKAKPGIDKYKIPRYSISTDFTMDTFKKIVN